LGCSSGDGLAADSMDTLNVLLLNAFAWDKTHRGSLYCLADRFGVSRIIFVRLDKRFNKLRCNNMDGVAESLKNPPPVVGSTTGLYTNYTARELSDELNEFMPTQLLFDHYLAVGIYAV
jgi:hypothetical protein